MDLGSELVYMYSSSEEEYVSEEELEEGMWLSCSEGEDEDILLPSQPPEPRRLSPQQLSPRPISPPLLTTSRPRYDSDTGTDTDTEDDEDDLVGLGNNDSPVAKRATASGSTGSLSPPRSKGIVQNRLSNQKVRKVKKGRVNWSKKFDRQSSRGRRVRRSDTNILAVKFHSLTEPSNVHTGDAVACGNKNCAAILSHLSSVGEKVWVCEFCGEKNKVDIESEEIPAKKDTTYIIAPPPTAVEDEAGIKGIDAIKGVNDSSLVIFCIDISGSMNTMSQVSRSHSTSYVNRLQLVQAAVDYQLSDLIRSHPTQRVALVTFNATVNVIGDGSTNVITLDGPTLDNLKAIMMIGEDIPLPAPVEETGKVLSKKIFALKGEGGTALGPALLLSISWASCIPGSKVIICTDGLANKGVGNLSGLSFGSSQSRAAAQTFYEDMGTLANQKNVTVSLVRIKGTDCKALELGQVADKTGGQVTTVDPLNITKEFSSILANPVIATNVTTRIVLHGQLYFRTGDSKDSVRVIPVGNVTAKTELTYEYGVRKKAKDSSESGATAKPEVETAPPLQIEGKPHLPFQLQIEYTSKDGSRLVRVITNAKPVTRDRGMAEKDIHMNVVGTHVAQRTAQLAMEGEYTTARLAALSNQRLLQRSSHVNSENRAEYETVMTDIIPLENALMNKQQTERATRGRQLSEDESEEEEFFDNESDLLTAARALPTRGLNVGATNALPDKTSARKKKKAISRRKDINDELATYCYNLKSQQYN